MIRSLYKLVVSRLKPINRWRAEVVVDTARAIRRGAVPSEHSCCICGYHGIFSPFAGWPVRPEARCPQCGSLERHRLLKLWIDANLGELKSKRVLHFAPEHAVRNLIKPLASLYKTADLFRPADLRIDIEKIELPDDSFDVIVCSHVLEHVNDIAALREIHRIVAPGGLAMLMTPVVEGWRSTYENRFITTPEGRMVHFGQENHVRFYGADIRARISTAGFHLDEYTAEEPLVSQYGLARGEKLFLARRLSVHGM